MGERILIVVLVLVLLGVVAVAVWLSMQPPVAQQVAAPPAQAQAQARADLAANLAKVGLGAVAPASVGSNPYSATPSGYVPNPSSVLSPDDSARILGAVTGLMP